MNKPSKKIQLNMDLVWSQYDGQGLNTIEISKLHGVSPWTIQTRMHESGFPLRNVGHKRITEILTEHQLQVIEGELLGDGSLSVGRQYRNAKFQWGGKVQEHGQLIQNVLGPFVIYFKPDRIYHKLITHACCAFTPTWELWYCTGKKRAPENLSLTPTSLLHWYLGDGYFKTRPKRRPAIRLCTQGFSPRCLEIMTRELNRFGLNPHPERNNRGFVLYFPTSNTERFLDVVGPCPIAQYSYKWGFGRQTSRRGLKLPG